MSCFDKIALTTCGTTVSPYPSIPGNNTSPAFSFRITFRRNSSFTDTGLYPDSLNCPTVRGEGPCDITTSNKVPVPIVGAPFPHRQTPAHPVPRFGKSLIHLFFSTFPLTPLHSYHTFLSEQKFENPE